MLVLPTRVQGEGAAAIGVANRLPLTIDCLVLARGGGSLEDLWAFNEEVVVRAIFASRIPVISAVGHEIGVTLSDLVADVRALTPSEAAELVAPAAEELLGRLRQMQNRVAAAMRFRLSSGRARWEALARSRVFRRPLQRIEDLTRRLDELETAAARAMRGRLERVARQLDSTAARLESLSPLAVLGRGYSVTQRTADGRVIRDAADLAAGQQITTRFARGETISRVEETRP